MTQLEQILNYLDREGVTEVIVAVGQPIQFRRNGALVPLTNAQLTRIQISALIANTPLAAVFGRRGEGDMQVGKRALRVTASGTTDAPLLSIVRATGEPSTHAPGPAVVTTTITERQRRPSRLMKSERAQSPSKPPRTRTSSKNIPRAAEVAPPPVANPPNRLTKSDIKFGTPGARPEPQPLDLDPRHPKPELDPPAIDLGARAKGPVPLHLDLGTRTKGPGPYNRPLQLDLDDGIELGLPGATPHLGSTPAIDAAFAGPPKTLPSVPALDALAGLPRPPSVAHHASSPAIDAAFAGPPPLAITPPKPAGPVVLPPALRALLEEAGRRRASDLHILVNRPVCARVLSELAPLRPEILDAKAVEALLLPLLDERNRSHLERAGYADLAIELPSGARLRTNIARCQGGLRGTFRIGRALPPTLDELGLPKELAKVVAHHQGLVVVSGPSGHGKTTTLTALVDLINTAHAHHIITVEDPIEIVYPRKAAVVSQREVGAHTKSFAAALKGSLREDPDVIVIGELRDRETVEIALTAAETGHLVLATMSTPSAAKTIDRLVDMFPPDDQSQVRASIAGALRAIVSQRLLPTAAGDSVVAAVELVTGVLPLANLIRDDKLFQLPSLMQRGKAFGMIRLDDSLAELVRAGKISNETALGATDNRKELAMRLQQGTSAIPIPGRKP